VALLIYLAVRYVPVINRIFHEQPLFFPLRVTPKEKGELVEFTSEDGLKLAGSYFKARTDGRAGVIVFCHEFLSNRWSCQAYVDSLRDLGFDIFSFDFRNHGNSGKAEGYKPIQWLTDHEVKDLRAALAYLRTRPDRDPAGFGLFGVSRGGNTALVVAAEQPDVWGVVTDGAFPTRGTMYTYIMKWAEIYITVPALRKAIPKFCYHYVSWMARQSSQRQLKCKFPNVEKAVSRLSPRPWLAIHGEKDTYIGPGIARDLVERARQPKDLWIVAGAKHNRCREREPEAYAARLLDFVDRFAPRRLVINPSSDELVPPARSIPISSRLVAPVESDPVNREVNGRLSSHA
jgi:pimeloyl-ACP methyl ester carboxylesterase